MSIEVYTSENTHISSAQGDDLTAWDNAQVKLASGELNPTDQFLYGTHRLPHPVTQRFSSLGAKYIASRQKAGRVPGLFVGTFMFQTAQFLWWILQTCATTGASAPYTHTISLNQANTPKKLALHLEHEHTDARRYDLMGLLPQQLQIFGAAEPGTPNWAFRQTITIPYAYANIAADDIAAQTKREQKYIAGSSNFTSWKTWADICESDGTGLGGHAMDVFTYNTNALEILVTSLNITITRNVEFGGFDTSGYHRSGWLLGCDYAIEIGFIPKGDSVFDMQLVDFESYAGDIDLNLLFQRDATNDKIAMTFDKLYAVPFEEEAVKWDKFREQYIARFEPLNEGASLAVVGTDSLVEGDYENTA